MVHFRRWDVSSAEEATHGATEEFPLSSESGCMREVCEQGDSVLHLAAVKRCGCFDAWVMRAALVN
jgi:hypothetical protein